MAAPLSNTPPPSPESSPRAVGDRRARAVSAEGAERRVSALALESLSTDRSRASPASGRTPPPLPLDAQWRRVHRSPLFQGGSFETILGYAKERMRLPDEPGFKGETIHAVLAQINAVSLLLNSDPLHTKETAVKICFNQNTLQRLNISLADLKKIFTNLERLVP